MAKKNIDSGTQGRTNYVLKRYIDFKGINKVPIVDKCPLSKSPTILGDWTIHTYAYSLRMKINGTGRVKIDLYWEAIKKVLF